MNLCEVDGMKHQNEKEDNSNELKATQEPELERQRNSILEKIAEMVRKQKNKTRSSQVIQTIDFAIKSFSSTHVM